MARRGTPWRNRIRVSLFDVSSHDNEKGTGPIESPWNILAETMAAAKNVAVATVDLSKSSVVKHWEASLNEGQTCLREHREIPHIMCLQ